ncbi:dihydrolipoyl dehydrogenase family protein [Zavarzinella formosa]|uniref:dihydrolipoyl dehydrogenase family protein n=1 Tax=Zavarzinella formosa TaxID=360055 RepID=UPI0002E5176F|nr:FAD-dependent oxidoreductase [Zavarzinella formosa]
MSNVEEYDLVVLGSGEAGKYLAWTLASQGKRVVVIERRYVGGSCPNIACLPSKNIIHSAKVASLAGRGAEFGVMVGKPVIDMAAVRARKRAMVDGLVEMHLHKFKMSGAELVMGDGRLAGPKTVEVALHSGGTRTLRGANVVINTGSRAATDPTPGLRESAPLTHIEALELDRVPGHLIVLGGGYVGLELAQAFRRFGSQVTVIDRNPALIHREDTDVSAAMAELFADEGIAVSTDTALASVEGKSGESVRLRARRAGADVVIEGTHLLVAAGRTPNTDGIGLETAGVKLTAKGFVQTDEYLRTTAEGVWAVGDCAGSPQFTHIGFDDFRIVRDNLAGHPRTTTGRHVPSCLFTDPELARVGLNEREAREKGIPCRLFKIAAKDVLRTRTISETRGFFKALVEADGDRILGFAAFGPEAGEVMPVVQMAMTAGLPYTALREAVLTHPTIAEGLTVLFSSRPTTV